MHHMHHYLRNLREVELRACGLDQVMVSMMIEISEGLHRHHSVHMGFIHLICLGKDASYSIITALLINSDDERFRKVMLGSSMVTLTGYTGF